KEQNRAVLLEGSPAVLLLRREQSVHDVRAVERRDRDQVEDRQDAVVEDDLLKDDPICPVEQSRVPEAERNRTDEGEHEIRKGPSERDRAHSQRRTAARIVELKRY